MNDPIPILILARMGSSRFPGKHLAPLGGEPMIGGILRRVSAYGVPYLATATGPENDPLCAVAQAAGARIFRGDEENVWLRVLGCALSHSLSRWVLYMGDCPFVDPRILRALTEAMRTTEAERWVPQSPINGIEGLTADGWSWAAWVRLGEGLARYPSYAECPWQIPTTLQTVSCPVDWRDIRTTPIKGSIDYPLEMAVANRIVAHYGRWPADYDELIAAYREVTL